jgi:hypothetical protein
MIRIHIKASHRFAARTAVTVAGITRDVPDGWHLRDLIADLEIYEGDLGKVTVNGKRARMDTRLRRDDEIELS